MRPAYLITIDTEGDNLWSAPAKLTTQNARWLPRFQALCEKYGLKPTYLTTYEMACCPDFVAFGRDVLRRNAGEIGMHLHAWNSPPIEPVTANDNACGPYATEYAPALLAEKVAHLTRLLQQTFAVEMKSHRAGRWAFDGVYAGILLEHGYLVDCSVTPGVCWKEVKGKLDGEGGPDYRGAPHEPYFIDPADVRRPGCSKLLELPVTILDTSLPLVARLRRTLPPRSLPGRALNRLAPPITWLRPMRGSRRRLLRLMAIARTQGKTYVEFVLHSSELMPGGSPTFPDAASIEALYQDLEEVFSAAAASFTPFTLTEFYYARSNPGRR